MKRRRGNRQRSTGGAGAPPRSHSGLAETPAACRPAGAEAVPWPLLIVLGGVLFVAVLVAHWPVLACKAFCFDDDQYLTQNIVVQNPSWANAWRFLREVKNPSTVGGYYQPLAMTSLMADVARGGGPDHLRPLHATALALHTANTLLAFALLWMLFRHAWAAAGAALLFGLHPMTVEPVVWIGERKTLLAAFFALMALVMYVRYAKGGRGKWLAGCTVAYALGLLSKPTSTPLPMLLLVLDYWPLKRLGRRAVLEKIPLFAIGIVSAVITVISQAQTAIVTPGQRGIGSILLTLCHNIVFYPAKILWPAHLSPYYPFPEPLTLAHPAMIVGVVGTAVLAAVLFVSRRWTPAPLTGWGFFFLAIFPTMGVIGFTIVIASDKYAYLPAVGLLFPLTVFLSRLVGPEGHRCVSRSAMPSLVLLLAVSEGALTRGQLGHWRDTETLYTYMLDLQPSAWRLHDNLSIELLNQGRIEEAAGHARDAIRLNPRHAQAYLNHGNALFKQAAFDEARKEYRRALELEPRNPAAHYNLANALQALGKPDEAIASWNEALRLKHEYPDAHANLAAALLEKGDTAGALDHCRTATRMQPNHARAHYNLGMALYTIGRKEEGIAAWRKAVRLDPSSADTCNNLGGAMLEAGKVDEAIHWYQQALRLQPNHELARSNLANALAPAKVGAVSTQSAPSPR